MTIGASFKIQRAIEIRCGDGVYFVIYDGEVDEDGNIQGTEIYRSAKLDTYSDAEHISIDISGIQKNLVLFMDKIGTNSHDNGDWADAKLIHVPDPNAAVQSGRCL